MRTWVQKPMPFPGKSLKTKEEEHYNKFCEWMKPLFLQIPLTDAIKLPPYSRYMKDIVTNKRKVPNELISTMLANYSFSGKIPEKLGDLGIPTIPCYIKNNYVRTTLCDLGAGVSVMPFSLYKRLWLEKLIPTDISLQMADKSTAVPIGICEDVPVEVANCLILTNFIVLDMPEYGSMYIILGRPFLNSAGAVIDCNKGKVTFNVNEKEHTVYFPKKIDKRHGLNSIKNIETMKVGEWDCPLHVYHKYKTIMGGQCPLKSKCNDHFIRGETFCSIYHRFVEMDRLGRWLGKKKTERSSRVTRSTASPSTTRVSYNEEIVPLELLDASPAKAMAFPCSDFMADAGIQVEFDTLCARAGLTRLVTSCVPQYETLTAIFVNSFRFYPDNDTVVFRIYEKLLTMPMSVFCEALGLPDIGEKKRKNAQTVALNTFL